MNVLVIGASRGLGKVLSMELSARGHKVVVGVRRKEDVGLDAFQSGSIAAYQMDVTDEESLKAAACEIKSKGITFHAVVQTAGVLMASDREKNLLHADIGDFKRAFDVNVLGIVLAFRTFYPLMEKGGIYIAQTSEGGSFLGGGAMFPAYGITKTAANKVIQTLRSTVDDVNVIAMHPGRMNTDMGRTTAQIEPEESAIGICEILEGKRPLKDGEWFVDYLGRKMQSGFPE
ncbi:MAG: SDR family NAD(P)-dependent oxidoreductase [Clostridium sp.]|nr:SDR family NAD(P)-dependent oxidoreductase [Clostridium sp.]